MSPSDPDATLKQNLIDGLDLINKAVVGTDDLDNAVEEGLFHEYMIDVGGRVLQ